MEEAWDRHDERSLRRLVWLATKILGPHVGKGRAATLYDDLLEELAGPERSRAWDLRAKKAAAEKLAWEEAHGEAEP